MSNAAVINATNASGQTAGSPITIETGGDVVLKLYGTGSGAWSLTAAFAPVVDGVTGAPITLTINEQTPNSKTSITKTGATQWVGWIMQANGIWEASGLVEGYTGDEALSDHIGTFPSVAALPTKAVKTGTRATVITTEYTYQGAAVGWVGSGGDIPYVGSIIPTVRIAREIEVDNPAVLGGRSVMQWSGSAYIPLQGAEIASAYGVNGNPLVTIAPGSTDLFNIHAGSVIPNYLIPNFGYFSIEGLATISNASGVSGALVGISISSSAPTATDQWLYALGIKVTPSATGLGTPDAVVQKFIRNNAIFTKGSAIVGGEAMDRYAVGTFAENATKVFVNAKCSSVTDTVKLWFYRIKYVGP